MRPIELYKFTYGAVIVGYTSSDTAVTYSAVTYEPVSIGRGKVESKNELSKAALEVSLPINNLNALMWMNASFDISLSLTLFVQTDAGTNVYWKGRLASAKPTVDDITLVFESIFTSMRRPGLRARYQRNCRHALYGRGCLLNKDDFDVAGSVTVVNGNVLTIAAAGALVSGILVGGMVKSSNNIYRFITDHSGSLVTITRYIPIITNSIGAGPVAVTLYPGCDRSLTRCIQLGNLPNYGGFPFIPIKNPFDGSSIV